jgi:hypothetical protein
MSETSDLDEVPIRRVSSHEEIIKTEPNRKSIKFKLRGSSSSLHHSVRRSNSGHLSEDAKYQKELEVKLDEINEIVKRNEDTLLSAKKALKTMMFTSDMMRTLLVDLLDLA